MKGEKRLSNTTKEKKHENLKQANRDRERQTDRKTETDRLIY